MHPLVEAVLQVASIVVGALIIVFQLGREHRNNLRLQKENIRDEQRLSLYRDLASHLREAETAIADMAVLGYQIPSALSLDAFGRSQGAPPANIKYRAGNLIEAESRLGRAISEVTSTLERHEIVSPSFVLFRYAITSQLEQARTAYQAYFSQALSFLPIEIEGNDNRSLRPRFPNDEEIANLRALGRNMSHSYLDLANFINDLSREAQNKLLGDLFENTVPERKPIDPNVLVISSDPERVRQLEDKFDLRNKIHPDALPSTLMERKEVSEESEPMATIRAAALILNGLLIILCLGYLAEYPITQPQHLVAAGLTLGAPVVSSIVIIATRRRASIKENTSKRPSGGAT